MIPVFFGFTHLAPEQSYLTLILNVNKVDKCFVKVNLTPWHSLIRWFIAAKHGNVGRKKRHAFCGLVRVSCQISLLYQTYLNISCSTFLIVHTWTEEIPRLKVSTTNVDKNHSQLLEENPQVFVALALSSDRNFQNYNRHIYSGSQISKSWNLCSFTLRVLIIFQLKTLKEKMGIGV